LWLLINQSPAVTASTSRSFDLTLAGALALIANLAYCTPDAKECERKNRAKVVPCELYARLLQEGPVDFIALMESMDFPDVSIIRTKCFVAIVVPARDLFLVGVRGTQFAYDWFLNVRITKKRNQIGDRFHSGFYSEAHKLFVLLRQDLANRLQRNRRSTDPRLFLSGHSLGGAIAAILHQHDMTPAAGCYTFAAPRICSSRSLDRISQPFALRRELDIVPHLPPKSFGYADFADQKRTNGSPYESVSNLEYYFYLQWLSSLAFTLYLDFHSMEQYVREVIGSVKLLPNVQRYWDEADFVARGWPYADPFAHHTATTL
jgi:Lipase (class 3)